MTDTQVFSILCSTMMGARRSKRYGRDCSDFERDWAALLLGMMRSFRERSFRVDRNYAFLTSDPKWREIFATSFPGRIADHLLCDTLAPYIDSELHPRTFNNRTGKGPQAAMNQVVEDICKVTEGYTQPARVMKWDLKGFFPNALCDEMERCFCGVIDRHASDLVERFDEEAPAFFKWLAMVCVHSNPAGNCELRTPRRLWREHIEPEKSLFSKPPGVGAPIGRLSSQSGMGLYMNDIVVWLNGECGIRSTLFMDDCVMVVPERLHGYALALMPVLRDRLAAKGVRMNERKFYDQPWQHGLEFLGSHIKPYRIHVNNCTYGRAVHRMREFNAMEDKREALDSFLASVNSYAGILKNRTDYGRLIALRDMAGAEWRRYCTWDGRRLCMVARPGHTLPQRLARKYHFKLKNNKKHGNKRKNQRTGVTAA